MSELHSSPQSCRSSSYAIRGLILRLARLTAALSLLNLLCQNLGKPIIYQRQQVVGGLTFVLGLPEAQSLWRRGIADNVSPPRIFLLSIDRRECLVQLTTVIENTPSQLILGPGNHRHVGLGQIA
jgi:hypothetical protein